MPDLALHAQCVRVALTFQRLCMRDDWLLPTTMARFRSYQSRAGPGTHNRITQSLRGLPIELRDNPRHEDPDGLIPCQLEEHRDQPISNVHAEHRAWTVDQPLHMFRTCAPLQFTAYPDGSTVPGSKRCGGYGVVICSSTGAQCEIGGHVKQWRKLSL